MPLDGSRFRDLAEQRNPVRQAGGFHAVLADRGAVEKLPIERFGLTPNAACAAMQQWRPVPSREVGVVRIGGIGERKHRRHDVDRLRRLPAVRLKENPPWAVSNIFNRFCDAARHDRPIDDAGVILLI